MVEFALGLTKTAVEVTLGFVKSTIEEEKKFKEKVQNDLVFITGELEMMQSFLKVANRERTRNEVVQAWVRQVGNVAFDVEDCVEFVIHLDNKQSALGWLRRAWHKVYCGAPPLPLDAAVEEIKQLKARVLDVSQRNTRYNLIGDDSAAGSSSSSMPIMRAEQLATASMSASALPMLREVWKATAKMCRTYDDDLKPLITSEGSGLQVITVCASAGAHLEATSIFRKAYYDPEICQQFKFRAWVNLAHAINPGEFRRSLMSQLSAYSHHQAVVDDELRQRYLVILDQVSAMSGWDIIQMCLPDSRNGSRIVVSTQDMGIALQCIGEPYQVSELRRFSNGQPITAFFKEGAGGIPSELLWQLKCRGVFSVLGRDAADHVRDMYRDKVFCGKAGAQGESRGVKFEHYCSWISLEVGAQDDQQEEVGAQEIMEEEDPIIQRCRHFLHEKKDCLIVVGGLDSTDAWDKLKTAFFSEVNQGSCILIVTDKPNVATYCADQEYRVLRGKNLVVAGKMVEIMCQKFNNRWQALGRISVCMISYSV